MDFPLFHLDFFGNRTLIAVIGIIHVFISHPLAVGAIPLVVFLERWGRRLGRLGPRVLFPPVYGDMVSHMKTTIDISDPLLEKAKQAAREDDTTLRELVERGLHAVLKSRRQRAFKLRRATFRGKGRQAPFEGAEWDDLRDTSYEGRGS